MATPVATPAVSGSSVRESFSAAGGVVFKGPECKAKATSLLEKFQLPVELFPLSTIQEFGHNESSGLIWMKQPARTNKEFPDAQIVVHYHRAIHGYAENKRVKNLVGFKVKDMKEKNLFISVAYNEIQVDGDKIVLLSEGGHPRSFLASLFRPVST